MVRLLLSRTSEMVADKQRTFIMSAPTKLLWWIRQILNQATWMRYMRKKGGSEIEVWGRKSRWTRLDVTLLPMADI